MKSQTRIKHILSIAIFCVGLLSNAHSGYAQGSSKEEEIVSSISASVMSPFCPGKLLQDCPSSSALDLRKEIRAKARQGKTEQQIRADLVEKFGEEMLRAAPEAKGFGLFAWWGPVLFLLLGGAAILRWLKRSSGGSDQPLRSSSPVDAEMMRRIEDEIRRD